jgi:hypothetical protein
MTTQTIAAATITNQQIRALRTEAAKAGDLMQVAICERALGWMWIEVTNLSTDEDRRVQGLTVDEARAECARVISAAQAQRD